MKLSVYSRFKSNIQTRTGAIYSDEAMQDIVNQFNNIDTVYVSLDQIGMTTSDLEIGNGTVLGHVEKVSLEDGRIKFDLELVELPVIMTSSDWEVSFMLDISDEIFNEIRKNGSRVIKANEVVVADNIQLVPMGSK
jgi:hypothetical protein